MSAELSLEQIREVLNKLISKFNKLEEDNRYILQKVDYLSCKIVGETKTIYQTYDEIIKWHDLTLKLNETIEKAKNTYDFSIIKNIALAHNILLPNLDN